MNRKLTVWVPTLLLALCSGCVFRFASGAFRFVALLLAVGSALSAVWAFSCFCGERPRRILRRGIVLCVALGAALCSVLEVVVITGDHSEIRGEPERMVILGAQVKPWGPSVLLRDRLDTALLYLEDHPELEIIVTGGQGRDEPVSEAQCMYDYLVEHGVDPDQIVLEDRSHNTYQNMVYTRELVERRGDKLEAGETLVVSNGFHLARARMLARRVWGGETVSTLAAPSSHLPSKLNCYIREAPALFKSWLLDR